MTSTQAAEIAAVAPSTIKRWADQGLLPFIRTAGGHRRFTRADVERFVRDQQVANSTDDPRIAGWLRCLVGANRYETDGRLLEARSRLGAWHRVADELGAVLHELGEQWAAGRLTIVQEHVASECLVRSLARVADALLLREDGPRAVLSCAADEEHTLGLALAELSLRELGWSTQWIGRRTPAAELERTIDAGGLALVAVSASAAANDRASLTEYVTRVGSACDANGVDLVVGGSGAWPEPLPYGTRLATFEAFHAHVRAREAA